MIDFPNTDSIESIADWVELQVIYEKKPLSKSAIFDVWQENKGDVDEADVDSVLTELTRRSRLYGEASPFAVDRKRINPGINWKDKPELAMCLIFSLKGVEKKKGKDDGTKLFEHLSREAAKSYLGGEAEVIGFPNERKLKGQIDCLCKKSCENIGHKSPKPKDKDKGVDIIAWKPHGDNRPNQVVLLLQCGAGANYKSKKPISLKAWQEFVHWSVDPIQGIMVPHIVSDEQLDDLKNEYTLIFDRVRIFKAIHKTTIKDKKLRKHILAWCNGRLN